MTITCLMGITWWWLSPDVGVIWWWWVSWVMRTTLMTITGQWVPMGDENRLLMKTSIGGDYHWGWRSWTVGTHLVATIIGWWSWSMAITDECHLPMMVTDYLLSWLMNTTEWWLSLASDGHLLATIIHDKDLLMRIMVGDYHLWRLSLLVTITFNNYHFWWLSPLMTIVSTENHPMLSVMTE